MAQHLADFWQGGATLEHVHGQGVAELVRALVRRIDVGPYQRIAHDGADAVRAGPQTVNWRACSQEQMTISAQWPAALQVCGDGFTDIDGRRVPAFALEPAP